MSLLMFRLDVPQIAIVTDTLATTPAGNPHLFVSKVSIVPHLDMVVAFTGLAVIGERWAEKLRTAILARDMDMVNLHAPSALREIEQAAIIEFGALPSTTTIYHLGYSTALDGYSGYAYRSENRFVSERMDPGFRIKPQPLSLPEAPSTFEEMIALGIQVRAEQDADDSANRVFIGGEFVLTLMEKRSILTQKIHRFNDFDNQWLEMNAALY